MWLREFAPFEVLRECLCYVMFCQNGSQNADRAAAAADPEFRERNALRRATGRSRRVSDYPLR